MMAEELLASVDATMALWREAFQSPTKSNRISNDHIQPAAALGPFKTTRLIIDESPAEAADGNSTSPRANPMTPRGKTRTDNINPEAYHRRLSTFQAATYFAKPLALSPLMCAAFGWENTKKDILKCPCCKATLCIYFKNGLDITSHDELCRKYLGMLASSHLSGEDECPFRSYASRWLKFMQRHCASGSHLKNRSDNTASSDMENDALEAVCDRIMLRLSGKEAPVYVPPFFLSLSAEYLRFEDFSVDGSVTRRHVREGALQIHDKLRSFWSSNELVPDVAMPEELKELCHAVIPDCDIVTDFDSIGKVKKLCYLLTLFGWSISEGETPGRSQAECIVKCNICLARSVLFAPVTKSSEYCTEIELLGQQNDDTQNKKRRHSASSLVSKKKRLLSMDNASIRLIDSHRVYCPHTSGFAFDATHESDVPGWKVVVWNLLKRSHESGCGKSLIGALWNNT